MENDFITIREAIKLTGKADITIRRLIKQLIKQNDPEATQMIKQEQAGGSFIYKISKDYLLKELKMSEPLKEPEEKKELADKTTEKQQTEIPEIIKEVMKALRSQLYIKDKQIDSLGNKIDELIKRDGETNIILKGLQDKVFILEAPRKPQNKPEAVETYQETERTEKPLTEAKTSIKQEIKSEVREKPKKRGFLSRLFNGKGDTL